MEEEEKELVTTKRNSLIRFDEDVEYKDLIDIFPELYELFMEKADQVPEEGGEELMEMMIQMNIQDLKENRKPPGHNREARYRMIFPLEGDRVQFFLYPRIEEEESEIDMITDEVSDFLDVNDFEHEVLWDQMRFLKEEED